MAPARRFLGLLVVATLAAVALVGALLRFAASEHPDPALRPTLTATWSPTGPPVSDKLVPREGA